MHPGQRDEQETRPKGCEGEEPRGAGGQQKRGWVEKRSHRRAAMAGEGSGFYWTPDGQALEEFKQELIPSDFNWKWITPAVAWRWNHNREGEGGGRPMSTIYVCQEER